jgi:hypothetical protein
MIADVIGAYLDSIAGREREFDAPFMALLRAGGYHDIHFLHGSFEFGKDFIAKGREGDTLYQFAFQTKAGNLGITEWRQARAQIDELRRNSLAHPSFDDDLPRKAVFVTTGRLIGAAKLDSQQYAAYLERQDETGFIVWDRETLVEIMTRSPEVGIASAAEGLLLTLLGKIDERTLVDKELEAFSRRWVLDEDTASGLWKSAVEAAVIANRLAGHERLDLACFTALCLVRAAWASTHGAEPQGGVGLSIADLGRGLFSFYASALRDRCDEESLDPLAFVHANAEEIPVSFVTYLVRCMRLIEILGLLGLLKLESGADESAEVAEYLVRFFGSHPGAAHPVSDRWAVSLIPPLLLLGRLGHRETVTSVLTEVTRWIADHYEGDKHGLAGPAAAPGEEVNYLLGTPFEHVELERRSESFVSTVILDLAAVLEMGDFFELARNEFLAVKAMACVVEAEDTRGQYLLDSPGLSYEPNMEYEEKWQPADGWKVAHHHKRGPSTYYLGRIGRLWDQLAASCVLRDRHFPVSYRALLSEGSVD